LAILTALTLRAVFRLAYRQAEELIGSITVIVPPRRTAVLSDMAAIAPSVTSISGASPRAPQGLAKKPPATTGAPRSRRRSDGGNR
jgi:hypothetical protein